MCFWNSVSGATRWMKTSLCWQWKGYRMLWQHSCLFRGLLNVNSWLKPAETVPNQWQSHRKPLSSLFSLSFSLLFSELDYHFFVFFLFLFFFTTVSISRQRGAVLDHNLDSKQDVVERRNMSSANVMMGVVGSYRGNKVHLPLTVCKPWVWKCGNEKSKLVS